MHFQRAQRRPWIDAGTGKAIGGIRRMYLRGLAEAPAAGIGPGLADGVFVFQSTGAWGRGWTWPTTISNGGQGRGFVKKENQKFTQGMAIGVGIGIVLYHIFFG